jgi:lysyl-tRNA synthetase class 2
VADLDGLYAFDAEWLAKVEALRAAGVEPWPSGLHVTHISPELHASFVAHKDEAAMAAAAAACGPVAVGGRLMYRNHMGKALFLRLQDRGEPTVDDLDREGQPIRRGGAIQEYVRRDDVGETVFELLKGLDIGDYVWAAGAMMRTRTGELTVHATEARLAAKCLLPFPDRWNAVSDVQVRSRQRYVDLFINEETRTAFRLRSKIVRFIRDFFEAREFLEVETPMMQPIPGGAVARPFVTHHNALDIDLYLRVAPELYLKRLVIGGLERVFEINRNFRNEGVSVKHNPEFTMLEFYQSWATMEDLIALTEALLSSLVSATLGGSRVVFGDLELDFAAPFARMDMDQAIAERTGLTLAALADPEAMAAWWAARFPDEPRPPTHRGGWWERIFERFVEPELVNPTFITGFPPEISPLARRSDGRPDRCDRFELYCARWELANGFSELADPVDQAERFAAQVRAREAGDDESMYFDADYIRALSYGMPPTAGEGIGIDRLVMMLTGRTSIREVILFPVHRPVGS